MLECCILYSLRERREEGVGVGEGRSKLLQARPGVGYRAIRRGRGKSQKIVAKQIAKKSEVHHQIDRGEG